MTLTDDCALSPRSGAWPDHGDDPALAAAPFDDRTILVRKALGLHFADAEASRPLRRSFGYHWSASRHALPPVRAMAMTAERKRTVNVGRELREVLSASSQ